jgi:uncharacterized protein involved in outer membrane biogenesis
MKRIGLILATVVVAVAALLVLLVALVPREALKARISEQIASWTGREVSARGEPDIGFFPLSVTLKDVRVAGPQGMADAEIISMDSLTGTVRLLPLVIGRIEVGSFTMVRPLVRLVRDQGGRRNWDFETGAAALQLAFEGDVPLGDFSLEGGTVLFEDRAAKVSVRLDSVNLSVGWSSVRNPIEVSGSGIWRGEQVTVSASATTPFAFLSSRETPLEARIEAPPISLIFNGKADDYPNIKVDGGLKVSTPSLRRLASWLGSPVGPGSTFGQMTGFGTATINGDGVSVENAEFVLDGNAASGALKIAFAPKLDVTGTVAFESLNLSPYADAISAGMALATDWRKAKLPANWLGGIGADIRLSADTIRLGELTAANAAASLSVRDRRLEIGLARAVFGEGSLSGAIAITDPPNDAEASVDAQLRASDVPFSAPAMTFGLPEAISGTGTLFVDVSGKGREIGSLIAALSGTARLSVRDATVPLFGLDDIAMPGSQGDVAPEQALGTIPVTSASLGLNLSGELATVEVGSVVTPTYSADLRGWIGLKDGSLGLNGTIKTGATDPNTLASADASSGTGLAPAPGAPEPLRFTIEGTLAEPVARPVLAAN